MPPLHCHPNTPLDFALQKENAATIKIEDLHRLRELNVRADARTRLIAKALKFEDKTEGADDDDDEVHACSVNMALYSALSTFSPFDPRMGNSFPPPTPRAGAGSWRRRAHLEGAAA